MITVLKQKIDSTDINKTLKKIAFYSWITSGVFFMGYIYFVGAITFSVIKERGLQQDTKSLISDMGGEELRYLESQKDLTKGYALEHGFIVSPTVSYASSQKAFAFNARR